MNKQELQTKQKAFAASLVSLVYAFVMQLTQNLFPIANQPGLHIDVSIFVPAIASILFGKLIGATGAAGGQLLNSTGNSLLSSPSSASTQVALNGLNFSNLILMVTGFIGAWVVGSLTEKPNTQWDTFVARFTHMDTWSRLFQNTLGSIIGIGMVGSLLSSYALAFNNGAGSISLGTTTFVQNFFLNSAIIVIFIPATLLLYEFGDILVQMRAHAKDKSLRKLAKTTVKEEAVTIISARLTETALTENQWTPVLVKFRANLDKTTAYKIEAVSTANYYPAFDGTEPMKKGDIWEQKFFIMPAKQKKVDFKIRITPAVDTVNAVNESVEETIVQINGKSYNPNSNSATLILFSIINSIMVGASVVWNNILSFNVTDALTSLKSSWVLVASTGTLEVIIFVPLLMYLRRRWTKTDSESLSIGFGMDLSERSQKIFQTFSGNFSQFFEYFSVKFQRSVKLFLVFVTTVSVILLGLEGYNNLNPNYSIAYSDQFLIIGVLAIVLWLGGYKGIDILKSAGIIGEEKYEVQDGDVVKKFKPVNEFFENTPNEVAFTITNPTEQKGIRFRFLSQDTISPPLVEMPVPSGQSAIFKTSITPIATGTRNIMVVVYPLFGAKGQYIDENSAEPYSHQYINYHVQSETQIGISKDQQSTLKKLLVLVAVIGAIVFGGGAFAQQLLGNADLYNLVRNNAPFLLALQGPFVYAYFYVQNKSKIMKGEIDQLIEQINAMDNIAREMNTKLDQSILKSAKFKKNMSSVLKTTLTSVTGLSAMNELNEIITKQINESLGDNFTNQVSKVVKSQDLNLFSETANKIISDNFSSDFDKMIQSEKNNLMSTPSNQVSSQVSETAASGATDSLAGQVPDSIANQINDGVNSQVYNALDSQSTKQVSNKGVVEAKQEVKTKLKEKFGDKIKKQTSKEITQILKDKSEDSFINQYKETLTANFKKTLSKEFRKQVKDGKLVDDIEEKVYEALGPEIQKQILDQINSTVFNRDILSSVAEDLDKQFGSSLTTEFENTIGTDMESEMADNLKQHLNVKYEKEVMDKLNNQIRKRIHRELNKKGDALINDILNSKLTNVIQDKMVSTIQESISNNLDSVVDKAIDVSVDTAFIV